MNKIESIQKRALQLLYKYFESNHFQLLFKAKKSKIDNSNDSSKIALSLFRNIQGNKSS